MPTLLYTINFLLGILLVSRLYKIALEYEFEHKKKDILSKILLFILTVVITLIYMCVLKGWK
jgi:hypothetical protein